MINFSERLKAARKMKGWSLEELSRQMGSQGISKQALSKYETGEMNPGGDTLALLCSTLGVNLDYFFRAQTVTITNLNFRKLQKYPAKMQDTLVAQTQDFIERYLELESLLGIESQFNVKKYTNYKISCPDDVEKAASYIRKEWKLGNDPLYNVVELLEDQHIKVFELNDDESFSGMSTMIDDKIPVIVLNHSDKIPPDRKRFTALHELGHRVMNLEVIPEKEHENYCHHFAGAMLIPKEKLQEEIGSPFREKIFFSELGQLKKQYGISMSALLFRLKTCGFISASYHKFMMIQFGRFGYRKSEPVSYDYKGTEESHRFLQLLLRGVAMELISTSKAAALNNMKLAEFRKILA